MALVTTTTPDTALDISTPKRAPTAGSWAVLPRFQPDPADAKYWLEMAFARGLRLPRVDTMPTSSSMEKWLHRLGLSVAWFRDWTGFPRLSDWIAANPAWGLRSFVGLMLEELDAPNSGA